MSEFKGTPGKWFYRAELGELASTHKGVIADLLCDSYQDENGYLLAAAPELLEELQRMVAEYDAEIIDKYEGTRAFDSMLAVADKARLVIAKALGQ